jgi:hypothetical protein
VQVREVELSSFSVDKAVESVDNQWIDLSLFTISIEEPFDNKLKTAIHPQKPALFHSYPHLFHIWWKSSKTDNL